MSEPVSPFHAGELRVQARLGVRQQMAAVGPRVIRDHLIEQHRDFFAAQHMLLLARSDGAGRPWASVLAGAPGFAHAPDPSALRVDALPVGGAPHGALLPGEGIGLLGIDYATRRRNRLNGRIATVGARGFELRVDQMATCCASVRWRQCIDGVGSGGQAQVMGPSSRAGRWLTGIKRK